MLKNRETAAFCSQLRSLLAAGLPLLEGLRIIAGLQRSRRRLELEAVIEGLNSGRSLSEAAAGLLPLAACGSLAAAERAGELEENLARLAVFYSGKADLEEKLAGALVYPAFVLALSLASLMVLVFFVIPGMKGLLADLGSEPPPLTLFILSLSDAGAVWWPALIVLPLSLAAAWRRLKRDRPRLWERIVLRVPVLSGLYRRELVMQTCGTLGALLKSGAPISEAVEIARHSAASPLMKQVLQAAGQALANGEQLSRSLAGGRLFPAAALELLRIGERTGQLDMLLSEIAGFQAREHAALLKRFVSLCEPCLTLAVGLAVGLVVLGLFLPLVDLVSSLQ